MIEVGKRKKMTGNKSEQCYRTVEELFNYKGFKCIVILNEIVASHKEIEGMKWRCGYVGVPKEHPLYKKTYEDIEVRNKISVHGGITFAQSGDDISWSKEYWWIGFACNNYGDNTKYWTFKEVKKELKEFAEQMTIKNLILNGLGNN